MRTDILDLHAFYETPLGEAARGFIAAQLSARWKSGERRRVAGFGHAAPYLSLFDQAERALALAPAAQGVMRWPADGLNRAGLVDETSWPLADASIDRLFVVHGLEEAGDPRRLMREAWRVLANDGRLIVVASHRRGLWSMIETTPFAAGRPWLRRQLFVLLSEAMFRPLEWIGALNFPPVNTRLALRAAPTLERAGGRLWPWLAGVVMIEAAKELLAPVGLVQRMRSPALLPQVIKPAGAATVARYAGSRLDGDV
jgi:SAM-dependent methyltransferase